MPDIIVLDISFPDISGIEITKIITQKYPQIKIIMLSMYTNEYFIFNSINSGAKGYLPKNISKRELIQAIHQVYAGNEYFSETIKNIILKSYLKKAKNQPAENAKTPDALTTRELEILKLVAEGLANQQIADKLFISIRTVDAHKNHIMQKLQLNSIVDLIKFAIRNKIVDL